jgi:signal transduction histidine kinase/DNA-binding NarL/FixJ family response regulator
MNPPNRRVLIVDDNRSIHDDFRKILQGRPSTEVLELETELFGAQPPPVVAFDLSSAYQGADGVEMVRTARAENQPYALALVDMRMPPGIDGLHTVANMWEIDPELQVVICTAYSDASWQKIVDKFGTTDRLLLLKKPFDLAEVCQLTLALTEKWKLARQVRARMAELAQSRAELAASLALARAVQDATGDGLLVVGLDRKISTSNRGFSEMWRISPELIATRDDERILGSVLDQLANPAEMIARVEYFYAHPGATGHDEIALKDGRVFERWTGPVRTDTNHVQGRLWWFRDITERRKLELDRAVVTERLASMGRLAAGVGHEINNPLTYALGNVENLLATPELLAAPPSPVDLVERLQETRDGLWRIRVIVRDLQTLARSDEAYSEVDLKQVIEQAIQIAGAEVRHRAPIFRHYGDVPPVLGNRTRLGQVFLNLILNAAQAIPDGQSASNRIEITIRDTGHASIVEVTDTGSGIAPEHVDRIFDPFFTTKEIGTGTGLGLSISREIVVGHRGTLSAKSALGVGTTMTVTLPHSERTAMVAASVVEPAPALRRARVLVIDDEPLIAQSLQKALSRHHVVIASRAREALARIAQGETFDIILCDLMMPDISGIDVHEYLVREHPAVAERVVYMTGGAFTSKANQFLSTIPNERIDKPFSLAQINKLVDRHLAAKPTP